MRVLKLLLFIISVSILHFSCSKVTGRISITYTKANAVYGNLDSLRNIDLVQEGRSVNKAVGHFIGKDYIFIGERSEGVHVFDNSDMRNPKNVAFLNIPFCKEFYVDGDYLYAESGYDLLKINIRDFRNPTIDFRMKNAFTNHVYKNSRGRALLGFNYSTATDEFDANSPEALEIQKQGQLHVDYNGKMIPLSTVPSMFSGNNGKSKGTINRIGLYYNHIYVVGNDKLHIFQTNESGISKSNPIKVDEGSETVYVDRNRLYVGSESMVRIYSLNNRSNPRLSSKVEHATSCDPVLAEGNIAYSTLRSVTNEGCTGTENVLMVLDVERANRAKMIRSLDMRSPYGMALINNHLFVGEGLNGLTIFDVGTREKPKEVEQREDLVAYDVMAHPTDPNIIIMTHSNGLKEYYINWGDRSLVEVGSLQYR